MYQAVPPAAARAPGPDPDPVELAGQVAQLQAIVQGLARLVVVLTTAADELQAVSHECRWMLRAHRKRTDPSSGRFLDSLPHHGPAGFLRRDRPRPHYPEQPEQ